MKHCRQYTGYSVCRITCKLHIKIVYVERRIPIILSYDVKCQGHLCHPPPLFCEGMPRFALSSFRLVYNSVGIKWAFASPTRFTTTHYEGNDDQTISLNGIWYSMSVESCFFVQFYVMYHWFAIFWYFRDELNMLRRPQSFDYIIKIKNN